jgi:amino acid permease
MPPPVKYSNETALGFAVGWTYFVKYAMVTPNQLTAGAMVISYWAPSQEHDSKPGINPAWWILVFHVLIMVLNNIGVRQFGRVEFFLSGLKILILLAMIYFLLVLTGGGVPPLYKKVCDFLSFWSILTTKGGWPWRNPGAFKPMSGSEYDPIL